MNHEEKVELNAFSFKIKNKTREELLLVTASDLQNISSSLKDVKFYLQCLVFLDVCLNTPIKKVLQQNNLMMQKKAELLYIFNFHTDV